MISTWNTRVARKVVDGEEHGLTGDLAAYVDTYDFTSFTYGTLDEIIDDHRRTAYWASRFGGQLPPRKPGKTPDTVAPEETVYVGKLLEVSPETSGYRDHPRR